MNWLLSSTVKRRAYLFIWLLLALWLSGCVLEEPPPTPLLIRLADTPVIPTATAVPQESGEETAVPPSPEPASTNDEGLVEVVATATSLPTIAGSGLRPQQAQLLRPIESGPDLLQSDWRPPPMPVPHALHPNDHYWLTRPIPSGFRNYDLEWYPYGTEPMLAAALPYRIHHGQDYPNDTGTPILAADSGTVIWAGPRTSARNGVNYYGNTVIIRHDWQWFGQDVYTLYAHTLELFVEEGERVERGQLIAGVGASGEVSGPHLHLEVRIGSNHYGNTRNPALWLAPYEGWGTLAGRFVDERGRKIRGALLTLRPENVAAPIRRQRTYFEGTINSDEVWDENFVIADLPAGRYTLFLYAGGYTFEREVTVLPGQTNFIAVEADFIMSIAATPHPTFTPAPPAPPPTPTPEE